MGVSGGIVCTLLSDWLCGGGVMLTRSGDAAVMGVTFGVTVMGCIVTLGIDGATLGGETGSCFDDENLLLWMDRGALKNS